MTQLPPERLEGDGFVVRAWRLDDAAAFAATVRASASHFHPWIGFARHLQTESDALDELRKVQAKWLLDQDYILGIFGDDGALLGGTGFHPRDGKLGEGTTEIGMWTHVDQAGRGLGTRVLAAMLAWAFTDWWWERVEWRCDTRNRASARVAEKAGMHLDGVPRRNTVALDGERCDTAVYAALRHP
jgi:RimJ/RimL family protein N-acetyltransferase